MTEAQKKAKEKYKAKAKRFYLDFWPTEMELLDWLNSQPVKQAYIKNLIKSDMEEKHK